MPSTRKRKAKPRPSKWMSVKGIRDRAILAFLTDTGCRAGGLLTLRLDDLDLTAGKALVSEKFDKSRVVPFTPYTAELLRQWLAVRPPEAPTVFCSLGPNQYARPLYMSGLHHLLERLKLKAGVTGRINPHSFRHGFAREHLKNGGDLATLARLMGHSNVSVTAEFYAVFTEEELADKHAQFSPMRSLYANRSTDEST